MQECPRRLATALLSALLVGCGEKIDPAMGGDIDAGSLPVGLEMRQVCFADHVEPILQAKCVQCHNRDFTFKKGLYLEDPAVVRKHLELIVTVTGNRVMPPRDVDVPETGRPGTPLTGEERAILRAWHGNGARDCGDSL